jgi:hypothetical protein
MALLPGSPAILAGSSAGLAEVQTVTVTGSKGTFTLTFNGKTTDPITFNASATTVQAALNSLPSIGGKGGSVTVSQSGSVYTITFGGSLAPQNVPQITAAGSGGAKASAATVLDGDSDQRGNPRTSPVEVQTVTINASKGTFTLTFNGQTTGPIAFNASATTVQAALNGLPSIGGVDGSVTVSQKGSVLTIKFGGSLATHNVPQITAAGSSGVKTSSATVQDGGTINIGAV